MKLSLPNTYAYIATRATIALCTALLLVTGLAFMLDERLLRDVNVWAKPVKFALSFGIHLATLLWLTSLLAQTGKAMTATRLALTSACVATIIEVFYVALQSARGRASHFNFETRFESFMYYQVMGGAALVLVIATLIIGVMVLRHARPNLSPGLRLGAGWGAIFSAIATLVVAGALASGMLSGAGPWIGSVRNDAGGVPLIGWSRSVGDLRVPHFFATHVIQALPILGWLADLALSRSGRKFHPGWIVGLGLVLSLVLVTSLFVQAIRGQPFIAFIAFTAT